MKKSDWKTLLQRWSDAILASGDYVRILEKAAIETRWSGFPPASEEDIAKAELRIRNRLPESYRNFLKTSNGWWLDGTNGPTRVWGIEEIRLITETNPELVEVWSKSDQAIQSEGGASGYASADFRGAIQISDDSDGLYLINPVIRDAKGEWQAIFFADWLPGAQSYGSFEALMVAKSDAFFAAHPTPSPMQRSVHKNLNKPPARRIEDPTEFIGELRKLGFFRFVSDATAGDLARDYVETHHKFIESRRNILKGRFVSPCAVLCDPRSGRAVNLNSSKMVAERGGYAVSTLRPLLSLAGATLGEVAEEIKGDSYVVALEGVSHIYFKLKDGRPAMTGGDRETIAARLVAYETAVLVNKVLAERSSPARVAVAEEYRTGPGRTIQTKLAFLVIDDDLYYLLRWSSAAGDTCRPTRPDLA